MTSQFLRSLGSAHVNSSYGVESVGVASKTFLLDTFRRDGVSVNSGLFHSYLFRIACQYQLFETQGLWKRLEQTMLYFLVPVSTSRECVF